MAWDSKISLKEFERAYIKRSNISRSFYNRWRITLPCKCDDDGCEGWASISKNPDSVHHHCLFSFPPINEYLEYIIARS
ncbi:hypothetical protein LCGC14_2295930 [marine sediment metagenome]|uniref:Post-SET domain-containing protein n=1 Tax=marine sediment metagenome TaxID=412755 RepID=A0A0F9CPW0_9ZZZZ